jgi:aryl sulfotransferase
LPFYDEASYVFCGRDPRDAYLSMMDHLSNLSEESRIGAMQRAGLPTDTAFPEAESLFPVWLTTGAQPWMADGMLVGSILSLAESWWRFRHLPNIFFTHYADLTADLEGEMRRLARFLGIEVDEERWPALVGAAKFAAMKERAKELAPGAHLGEWRSADEFFHTARMGQWKEGLSAENQALYQQRYGERCDPDLKAWLEAGHASGVDPKGPM